MLEAAAVVAVAPREAVVLAAARLVPVRLPVLADPRLGPAVRVQALAVLVQRLVLADPHPLRAPAAPLLAQLPVLVVHVVLEPVVPVQRLLSRQSFSAAMAWSSPRPAKPSS
jgi:hypothetical protein